jgi:hypothetical protein
MNKAGFALCIAALLLITACKNASPNVSQTEGSAAPSSMSMQSDKVTQAVPQESSSADINQKLADKLNVIAKDSNNMMQEIASLRARLYLTPELKDVYDITPAPKMENGWYVIDQITTLQLKGYNKAKRVQFMATSPYQQLIPAVLTTDQNPSDGWSYKGPLIGKGNTVVWAEVTEDSGNVVRTPVIPVLSNLEDDATALKPAELFKELSDPKAVVEQFYKLIHTGDYPSAWDLIHPSARDHPASGAKNAIRQQFLALKGTKGPELEKIISSKLLETYKINVTQLLVADVMEMKLKLIGEGEKTIHLLKDQDKRWRLFWEPDQGLE